MGCSSSHDLQSDTSYLLPRYYPLMIARLGCSEDDHMLLGAGFGLSPDSLTLLSRFFVSQNHMACPFPGSTRCERMWRARPDFTRSHTMLRLKQEHAWQVQVGNDSDPVLRFKWTSAYLPTVHMHLSWNRRGRAECMVGVVIMLMMKPERQSSGSYQAIKTS